MKSITTKTAGIAAVAAAAVIGLGAAGIAQADDSSTAPSTPGATSSTSTDSYRGMGGHAGAGRMDHGARLDELASALASKLGLDKAKVEDAITATRSELRGTLGAQRQKGVRPSEADRAAAEDAFATALAKQLGVDASKVKSALAEVRQQFRAERFAEHEADLTARLDQAVKDGTLTRAEADAVLKAAKAGVIGMGGGRH